MFACLKSKYQNIYHYRFFLPSVYIYIGMCQALIRCYCSLPSGALVTHLFSAATYNSTLLWCCIRRTELTDRAPRRFTGWLRPLQHCDLPPSDPSWQRREAFKDSNCGEQTLDALCRAPPAGLGTASTLLAPMLPRSIEAFCEWKQAVGERWGAGI